MGNILSITTFIPLIAAFIMMVFLRGEDEAAQKNAAEARAEVAVLVDRAWDKHVVQIKELCCDEFAVDCFL